MGEFVVERDLRLSPEQAWSRLFDLAAHTAVIPLTRVTPELVAADFTPGSEFVARTGIGPLAVDDRMVVEKVAKPTATDPGGIRIRKQGRVIRGSIEVTIEPTSTGSRLRWRQRISIPGFVGPLDRVVGAVARRAYGRTIDALLSSTRA